MISLVQTTRVPAAPERVWRFLSELDAHYADWHPEHLTWRTLRGEPLSEGAVVFGAEWLGPLPLIGRFFIGDVVPERYFSYRFALPASLVGAGGSFRLSPDANGGCELTAEAHLGFSAPLIGPLVDRLLARLLPIGEFRRHMREEGENLIRLVG